MDNQTLEFLLSKYQSWTINVEGDHAHAYSQVCDQCHIRRTLPDTDLPSKWPSGRNDDFRSRYARAREAQAEVMDDEIMKIGLSTTTKNAAANRVKFEALRWRAAKLAPKEYGDSTTLKHTDSTGEAPPRFIIDLSGE